MNEEAREAGRALAERAGPVTDPRVIARVAALVHAAFCNTSPYATGGRPQETPAVNTDPGGHRSDVRYH